MQEVEIKELKWISSKKQITDVLTKKGCSSRNVLLLPLSNHFLKKRELSVYNNQMENHLIIFTMFDIYKLFG